MFSVRDVHRQLMRDWRLKMTGEPTKHPILMSCFTKPRYYCLVFAVLTIVAFMILTFSQSREKNVNLPLEVSEEDKLRSPNEIMNAAPQIAKPDVPISNNDVQNNLPPVNPVNNADVKPTTAAVNNVPIEITNIPVLQQPQLPPIALPNPAPESVPAVYNNPQLVPVPSPIPRVDPLLPIPNITALKPNVYFPKFPIFPEPIIPAASEDIKSPGISPPEMRPNQPKVTETDVTSAKDQNKILQDQVWKYMFNLWKEAALAQANKNPPIPL